MTAVTLFLAPAGSGKSHALRRRLAELEHAGDGSRVAVVDGLEAIARDPVQLASLVAEIDTCDRGVRWLIASRGSAGVPIASWLADGRIEIVGPDALRVTGDGVPEWTEGWAIAAALQSRELVHSFLEERAYGDLDGDDLALLEAASLSPGIDVRVLEAAGFQSASAMLERIHARTCLVRRDGDDWRFAFDLIRESIRRRVGLMGQPQRNALYARIAAALEACGDDAAALRAYAAASDRSAVVRVLLHRGFDLLDAGAADAVLEAVDALDTKTRREDGAILALRGVAHAGKGRPARGEALLRRGLAHAAGDCELFATITLRLALMLANRGDDVRELLAPIADDSNQQTETRAEALSLIAAQRALSNDAATATAAVQRVKQLLPSIDHDIARAKVLQRVGVAAVNTGDIDGAQRALEEAADLAMELKLYSLASRAYLALALLSRKCRDDVNDQRRFAEGAVRAADLGGNVFDLEAALLQKLDADVARGDMESSLAAEERLTRLLVNGQNNIQYLVLFRAVRRAWEGDFAESHRLLSRCRNRLQFEVERLQYAALFALLLEMDDKRDASVAAITEIWSTLMKVKYDSAFERRQHAIALLYATIARSLHGRFTQAESALALLGKSDVVVWSMRRIGQRFVDFARRRFIGSISDVSTEVESIASSGYAEVGSMLRAISKALAARRTDDDQKLSPTERTVLQLLNEGLATKQIATRTGRSIFTIRAHIANAIGKLSCNGRAEALAEARRRGIIS